MKHIKNWKIRNKVAQSEEDQIKWEKWWESTWAGRLYMWARGWKPLHTRRLGANAGGSAPAENK